MTVAHFPDEVCRNVWLGMQNWPLSALMENGRWGCPWGLCSGPGDRELPYIPHALGRCVIPWPFGKVATLPLSPPQASGASTSSFVVVPIQRALTHRTSPLVLGGGHLVCAKWPAWSLISGFLLAQLLEGKGFWSLSRIMENHGSSP